MWRFFISLTPSPVNFICRFLCLGLGLLYLGKQERADIMLEAVRTVDHKRGRYAEITLNTCAYAGTGNVLKVCKQFDHCAGSQIWSVLHCTALYCTALSCTVLHCTIQHPTPFYSILPDYTILLSTNPPTHAHYTPGPGNAPHMCRASNWRCRTSVSRCTRYRPRSTGRGRWHWGITLYSSHLIYSSILFLTWLS